MPNEYGLQNLITQVPSGLAGLVVQSFQQTATPGIDLEVRDEEGRVVGLVIDDVSFEGTVEAIFNGGSIPTVGSTYSYNSNTWVVKGVDLNYTNGDTYKVTLKLKRFSNLSLS